MSGTGEPFFSRVLRAAAPGSTLAAAVRKQEAWLPRFLGYADTIPAGPRPYHEGSVLAHTARCMDAVAGDALATWMALTHDAGKLTTPRVLWPHHYGHESRGKRLAVVWARQLGLPEEYLRAGVLAAGLHMKAGRYGQLRPGKKFALLQEVAASGFFTPFWKVVDADIRSAVSETAAHDWRRIRALDEPGANEEKRRQEAIALLKTLHSP